MFDKEVGLSSQKGKIEKRKPSAYFIRNPNRLQRGAGFSNLETLGARFTKFSFLEL